ncbi:unnamed protein product [Meganyctiphanes norvegica]|uniref:Reverse transcriptase domain-containing protein n=1 Tax=Meganyctiphanes norvegica TaxID=48144 RepID=A0AAV2SF71_MEGNR
MPLILPLPDRVFAPLVGNRGRSLAPLNWEAQKRLGRPRRPSRDRYYDRWPSSPLPKSTTSLSLLPPPRAIPNPSQLPAIRSFLPGLLSRRIIRKIYFPRLLFFSRLFLVGKKGGSLRLVIDLSLLNQFLFIPSFHMESVPLIASGIVDPLWGCTLDLEDAYYHVPVNWFFQMFLAFVIDGQVYVFQYLPFGLSTAPWAFNRVMKPIKSHLHQLAFRVHSFLDDFLFLHSRRDGLEDLTEYALSLFRKLGFRINLKKSFLSPSQTIEYLGVIFHLDSLTLSPSSQDPFNHFSLPRHTRPFSSLPPSAGELDRAAQFRFISGSTGPSSSPHLLDELPLSSILQGSSSPVTSSFQIPPGDLVKPLRFSAPLFL